MQRIKLLYVITKLELGGAQKQLLSLINCLDKQRFEPFLFTAEKGFLLQEALSIQGLTIKQSRFLERKINILQDILALAEIYFFIKRNNIEIVHTHSSKAGILGRFAASFAKAKIIVHTIHGWSFNDYQPAILRRLFICLERFAGKFAHRLIVVSYHDKQTGLENNIGWENKYTLIRYGIDFAEFNNKEPGIREELGISPEDLVVTNISCFKPQKSPLDFIKAAFLISQKFSNNSSVSKNDNERMQDARGIKFLLVGDGKLRKKIEKSILKFNLQEKVILTGWRNDIPRILSGTDVLVLNSLWEGLPIAVLEALAAGRPVVATDTLGIKEVIFNGENGFLVPCRDTKQIAHRLSSLLNDSTLRRNIGQKARDSLNADFTISSMVRNTQNLYYNLMGIKLN